MFPDRGAGVSTRLDQQYLSGAAGEERTAKVLTPLLKKGWVIVHDLSHDQSNVDHVVIGPGGVFVLDSKNLSGTAVAEGGTFHLTRPGKTRRAYSHDYSGAAKARARYANYRLRNGGLPSRRVEAVIVVWVNFPQQSDAGDRMTYVHGDHLVDWLLHRPARLNAVEIDQIADLLQAERHRPAPLSLDLIVNPTCQSGPAGRHAERQLCVRRTKRT